MAGNDTTVKFRADISQLKSQMQAAERQIKLVNSEFKAATAGMNDWTKSADGLTAKTKQLSSVLEGQNKKLELMEKELQATVAAYGENSAAADRVRIKINEQKAAIANTESQLKTYEQKLSELSDSMDKAADGSEDFKSASDKLKDTISEQESKLESLKKHYSDLVIEGKGVSDEAENTAREIKELSNELNENKEKLEAADSAADEFDDSLKEMDDAADKAADGFTVMKGALADLVADGIRATIGALKDLAKETFEVGSNFEAQMSKVGAISGANAEELEQLTAKAEEMGAKTKFSATESAEAFNYMAMAGWKTEDMLDGIEGIMNLAAASGSDLATASDIVTDALTAMGYGAQDAGKLADVMAVASSNANTNVEMMGQTFKYAAPIVGALGYNMEDTAVAIGLMANSGIKADKAGTALRSILTRLSAPPKQCAAAMDQLGISLTDEEGNMKSLNEVMTDLRIKFRNLSETEQTAVAKHLAGAEAMSGLLAIVNASDEDFQKLTYAVNNSTGAAEDMANTMNDNVSGALTLLKSKVEGIMIKLFNRAKDSMRDGIDTVGNALDKIDWDKVGDGIGTIAKKAADLFAYAVDNSDTIIRIIKAIGSALAIVFVTNKVASFTSVIGSLITALSSAKSGTEALSVVTKTLGVNMSALPIAVLVSSMAALYAYMQKQEQTFADNAEAVYGLNEAEKELISTIDESAAAVQRANNARKENGQNIDLEYSSLNDLKDQYNALIDENGKVKEGYEDLAEELLGNLAAGLNTTIDNIKENIDQNGLLSESIDALIQKKKDEAKLSAFESDYNEALKNELKYFQELKASKEAASTAQDELTAAQDEYNKAVSELEKYASVGNVPYDISMQAGQAQKNLEAAKKTVEELSGAVNVASSNWGSAQSTIEHYQNAMAASTEGNADKMNDALLSMQYGLKDYTTASKKELDQQYQNTKKDLEDIEQLFKEGQVSEQVVNDYKRVNKLAGDELDKWVIKNRKAAENSGDELNAGLEAALPKVNVTSGNLGVGSQMALFEGLGDWRDIADEKAKDYMDGLENKQATAKKKSGEIGDAAAEGLENRKARFKIAAQESGEDYNETLGSFENEVNTTGATVADAAAAGAKSKTGEFKAAGNEAATEYKDTIDSFSGDYTKSGESAAVDTASGIENKVGNFTSAGDKVSNEFVVTIDAKSGKFNVTGQKMTNATAEGAENEAPTMQTPAESLVNEFTGKIDDSGEQSREAGSKLASEAVSGADSQSGEAENSGKNFAQGFINGIGSLVQSAFNKAKELAQNAWNGLRTGQQEGSPSKLTRKSGVYFSQGYINGIKSMTSEVVYTAANVGKDAVVSLQKAQQEGSPSELTYQSGVYFTQGFINGMASLKKALVDTSKNMVASVVKELSKLNEFDFSSAATNASNSFSNALNQKMTYTSGWIQYQNEQMLADFDKTISSLQAASDKEINSLTKSSTKAQNALKSESSKVIAQLKKKSEQEQKEIQTSSTEMEKVLQKQIDKIKKVASSKRTDAQKKELKSLEAQLKNVKNSTKDEITKIQNAYKKEIDAVQTKYEKLVAAEQKSLESATTATKKNYDAQITAQQSMKEEYQRASSSMMTEFNTAMNDYQSAAQSLIDATMEGITSKYQNQYDKLINKQNVLIEKLQDAGSAFSLSDANLLTTQDIKAQTEQITRYGKKLQQIKEKVSDELFQQIASYDMQDSEAFIDRLLKMSQQELDAYNRAYVEKLNAADELAQSLYKKDFEKVAADYETEIKNAFEGIEDQLEALGQQCFNGFISGLTDNTSYMSAAVKTFVSGMITTFKQQLGIASPSKVTKKLGKYTAEGFADGISQNVNMVTSAVSGLTDSVKDSFDWDRLSLVDGFTEAVNQFESKAKETLTKSITEIGNTYQTKANEIFTKQETLAKNLKNAGSLFTLSNLNLMTTKDLQVQTAQINKYAEKLQKIKDKVSAELFEQILTYDMKDGEQFINRLLSMSTKELDAYNKAYTNKILSADKLAEKVYSKDLDKVANDYNKEIEKAFAGLDDTLTEIGKQCLAGFVSGLTSDSGYISTQVQTMLNGMIATFKKELGIASPSKVTKKLGKYTAEGFAEGIEKNAAMVTDALNNLTESVKNSFDWSRLSLVDGFSDAMADFEEEAKARLSDTITSIGDTYEKKANELFTKQENLAKSLKSATGAYNTTSLKYMTTKDLQAQTKQINEYASKLEKIKNKVSEELFDEILSYDMKDGEEFINRLLSMSKKELDAYNKAYSDKLAAADKMASKLYANDLDKVANDYNKEIQKAFNGLDDELVKIGKQCLAGFVSGLTSDTKYINSSVQSVVNTMIATFKKELGIHSPSKVTKKLGRYTAEGFAEGIEQNADMVEQAIENMTASVENGFDWSRLSLVNGFDEAVKEFESKAKELLTDSISNIGDTYEEKFNEIINKRDNLAKSLKNTGDLFTLTGANVMKINDLNAQIKDIQNYTTKLQKIKGKVSSDLFEQITAYNVKEGSAFIDRLLAMSDKELKAYNTAYSKKLSLSEQLSDSLYKSDLDKVAKEYDTAIEKAFKNLPASLKTIGTQTMQGFLQGLGGDAKYFTEDVKKIVNSLVSAFKKELGIASPSKVMEELGEYTGEGFEIGLMSVLHSIKDAAKEISDTLSKQLEWQGDISGARGALKEAAGAAGLNRSAGTFAGANTQIINFNQTNNSPKALDRLTLYRQTNNMLFTAKVRLSDV